MQLLAVNVLLLLTSGMFVWALDNGLALTPPMGWLTWERFRCNRDCKNDSNNCIGEKLLKDMADKIASEGYKEVGYEYIVIDDCWLASERDSEGRLQPEPSQFPNGIPALVDYIHGKGLKFGIYEDFGKKTCAGYPGSEFYMSTDAKTFADWGVDYLKFDGCNSNPKDMDYGYPIMGNFLNKTNRPMVFSCEWPLYQWNSGTKPDYNAIRKTCNLWRMYTDLVDDWGSVRSIIEYLGNDPNDISLFAGPGGWNDPDMLTIGNFGLSHDEERIQMGIWAIMAAPLMMSTDLRVINNQSKALLQNKRILAINQDKMGIQGKRLFRIGQIEVWTRPILPKGSLAVAVLNFDTGSPVKVASPCAQYGMKDLAGYTVSEAFDGKSMGVFKPNDTITFEVNPHGIFMFAAMAQTRK